MTYWKDRIDEKMKKEAEERRRGEQNQTKKEKPRGPRCHIRGCGDSATEWTEFSGVHTIACLKCGKPTCSDHLHNNICMNCA